MERIERGRALRGEARGFLAGQAVFGGRAAAPQRGHAAERHARHRGQGGAVVVGGPFDQAAQALGQWRDRKHFQQWAQLGLRHVLRAQAIGFPDDAQHLPGAERGNHNGSEFYRHALGDAVVEDAKCSVEDEDSDAFHVGCI